jgi:hypothetical protein
MVRFLLQAADGKRHAAAATSKVVQQDQGQ